MLKQNEKISELENIKMKKKTLLIIILFAFLSCNNTSKVETQKNHSKIDSLFGNKEILNSEIQTKSKTQDWYDVLIVDYIKKSDNKLIKMSLNKNERIEWLLDRTEKTDSTNYYIFNIGQDVSQEDGTELRFVSQGWIYIDSISKRIYEYDLPNDSLIVWKNKHNR